MRLRILSYNIHRAIGIDRRFRPERIVHILKHHQPDLALLQEVDVGVPRSRMLDLSEELADAAGYPHHAVGLNVELRQGCYGNATLSRYPILEQHNIDLTVSGRKSRGCLYTKVAINDTINPIRPLEVFNTHLGLSSQERVRQIGTLLRSPQLARLATDQGCLVGGDFNDWGTILTPIFTDILGFECATNHSRGYNKPYLTYPSFSPTGGLDKIFYRGPLHLIRRRRCWMRLTRIASDHLPIIADFEF